jgi:hypothetical protein
MCDYSLHAYANRLAQEGEELILTRFPNGSAGFTSELEYRCRQQTKACPASQSLWQNIRSFCRELVAGKQEAPLTAVCVPPGARLRLSGITKSMQNDLGVSDTEEVTFTQLGWEAYTYRDAVRFNNGRELLIFRLPEHQRASVLSMGGSPAPALNETLVADFQPVNRT